MTLYSTEPSRTLPGDSLPTALRIRIWQYRRGHSQLSPHSICRSRGRNDDAYLLGAGTKVHMTCGAPLTLTFTLTLTNPDPSWRCYELLTLTLIGGITTCVTPFVPASVRTRPRLALWCIIICEISRRRSSCRWRLEILLSHRQIH